MRSFLLGIFEVVVRVGTVELKQQHEKPTRTSGVTGPLKWGLRWSGCWLACARLIPMIPQSVPPNSQTQECENPASFISLPTSQDSGRKPKVEVSSPGTSECLRVTLPKNGWFWL